MTGFGRGIYEANARSYTVEIKTVNHKYSDISIKLPKTLSFLEEKVRKKIQENVSRGKTDVNITFYNYSEKGKKIIINKELAENYLREINELCEKINIPNNLTSAELIKLPEILTIENTTEEDLLWGELENAVSDAIAMLNNARNEEGNKICIDLIKRIDDFSNSLSKINEYSTKLVEEYILKLENRIKELLHTDIIDEARLAQEVVIYSDKISIEEELTRLKSHISQFKTICEKNIPIRKKFRLLNTRNE